MTAPTIIAALKAEGHVIYTRPYELNIVGVRSASSKPNSFDDTIHVLYKNDKGAWQLHSYPATTDPGTFWLKSPMNAQGTAMLKAGQYPSYALGMHRGQYKALVQSAGKVTVIRDADRDAVLDFKGGSEATGSFGINIHRASSNGTTKTVDKYSAGCQVFANIGDFNAFMALCDHHRDLYGNRFTYTLLDRREVRRGRLRMASYAAGIVLVAVIAYIIYKRLTK